MYLPKNIFGNLSFCQLKTPQNKQIDETTKTKAKSDGDTRDQLFTGGSIRGLESNPGPKLREKSSHLSNETTV